MSTFHSSWTLLFRDHTKAWSSCDREQPRRSRSYGGLGWLRLTEVYTSRGDRTFKTIAASAPNLTHLRLDHRNPYHYARCKEFLGDASQKPDTTISKFPVSSEKLFLHPGMHSPPGSYICGTGFMVQFSSMKALRILADTNPRFILLKEDEYTRRSNYEVDEGLTAWLGEINGQPSYWEEPTIWNSQDLLIASKNFHIIGPLIVLSNFMYNIFYTGCKPFSWPILFKWPPVTWASPLWRPKSQTSLSGLVQHRPNHRLCQARASGGTTFGGMFSRESIHNDLLFNCSRKHRSPHQGIL